MARTDAATRVIPANTEQVYAALTTSDALVAWLPPDGMTGTFDRFDPRVGGGYRLVLTYEDAGAVGKSTSDTDVVDARFVELVPPRLIVQAVEFVSDDAAYAGTMTMTWELTPVDGGTRVDIRAEDVPPGISAADHAAGMAASLSHLATYLERP